MRQTDAARLEKERLARKEAARRAKVSHSLHPVGRVAHPLGLFFFPSCRIPLFFGVSTPDPRLVTWFFRRRHTHASRLMSVTRPSTDTKLTANRNPPNSNQLP